MAKNNTPYLIHDCNAGEDKKIVRLINRLGAEGYGIFWLLNESIRREKSYELPLDYIPDFIDRYRFDKAVVHSVIDDFELYIKEGNVFYSERIKRDMSFMEAKFEKQSKGGILGNMKRWGKIPEEPPIKPDPKKPVKAPSEEKIKYADFVYLTQKEYDTLCKDYKEDAVKWFIKTLDNYKGANGKKYKSDYRAILSWVVEKYEKENKGTAKKMVF